MQISEKIERLSEEDKRKVIEKIENLKPGVLSELYNML
ncbi:hypothetical protein HNR33_001557 [Brassicibacter mesophilus]